jgi:peptidoglycan hydrolase-like protein with peptidoglycan-binding domain
MPHARAIGIASPTVGSGGGFCRDPTVRMSSPAGSITLAILHCLAGACASAASRSGCSNADLLHINGTEYGAVPRPRPPCLRRESLLPTRSTRMTSPVAAGTTGAKRGWSHDRIARRFRDYAKIVQEARMTKWPVLALLLAAPAFSTASAQSPIPMAPRYEQPLTSRDVGAVQERLRALGFYDGSIDGNWGQGTQVALQRFQENRGLQVTGDLNPVTVSSLGLDLNALLAEASGSVQPAGPPSVAQPLRPTVVRTIQYRLHRLGFYRGYRDGVWGPSTEEALERFQESRGMQASGQPTPSTLAALGLDPNNLVAEGSSMPPR